LRIEARAAGLEYADDSPLARRETEPLAERSAPEPASDRVACDHFRGSRLEHAPFDDAHPRAQGEPARRDAADHDIRGLARFALREIDQHDRLFRDQRQAILTRGDVCKGLDDTRLSSIDTALHFGLRAAAD